ncbi:MAG: hypothetical protein GX660_25135 [Clostridiaceae bacterium]|nr:hypothetical protein [Clostridiaceae bacterium]
MTEPLVDKIISLLLYIFGATWVLGWIILLLIMLNEKLFPKYEQKLEETLDKFSNILSPIMHGSLIAVGILFLIYILSNWLGWTK